MKVSKTRMVAVLLALSPLAAPALAQTVEFPSGPLILQIEPTAEQRSADVKVIRGSVDHSVAATASRPAKTVPDGGGDTFSGDHLWLVDRKAGALTGCFLVASIHAGNLRDIRCVTRLLP